MILSLDCHFLAQVKRNCRKLWETIAMATALSKPIASCEYEDHKHGYNVRRSVRLYKNEVELPKGWNGIERFVKVRRSGIRKGKHFHELAFYVLSKPINSAAVVAQACQGHWSVENQLHWVKDVNLNEDGMSLRNHNEAANLAYLNNLAINILKTAGHKPSKDTFAKITNNVKELYKLFYSV